MPGFNHLWVTPQRYWTEELERIDGQTDKLKIGAGSISVVTPPSVYFLIITGFNLTSSRSADGNGGLQEVLLFAGVNDTTYTKVFGRLYIPELGTGVISMDLKPHMAFKGNETIYLKNIGADTSSATVVFYYQILL